MSFFLAFSCSSLPFSSFLINCSWSFLPPALTRFCKCLQQQEESINEELTMRSPIPTDKAQLRSKASVILSDKKPGSDTIIYQEFPKYWSAHSSACETNQTLWTLGFYKEEWMGVKLILKSS